MSQHKTSQLKTWFDELEETNGDDECRAWIRRTIDCKAELAAFVAERRKGGARGTGTYVGFLKGSFNFSFRFSFNDGQPDVIIRFPKPGHTATAWRDEKVENEVQVMEYLRQHTNIPIPRVHSWGLLAEGPRELGPFIIMDYIDGTLVSTILKDPNQEDMVLNPNIDNITLDKIYDQATVTTYPPNRFSTAPFNRSSNYLKSIANEHLIHLWTQRNLSKSAEIAQQRFIARHRFAQLISTYYPEKSDLDSGRFIPFCDDMRPSNMLVNPETLQIMAVIDLEFTNAMPAQFAQDPPWWLLLAGPEDWLERDAMDDLIALYTPRMERFLRALERRESEQALEGKYREPAGLALSDQMRESWNTKRFWFDYAARKSFDVDTVYWAALHCDGQGVELLDEETRKEMELFARRKMEELQAYKKECTARFSKDTKNGE
ncbi:hypothetical protein BJY00DRAFT_323997 [Aspergillus carlsbadensis]|nr:hypothetical protein BJY00DRAFT_323997 [Aspergillus carlsbadensis]